MMSLTLCGVCTLTFEQVPWIVLLTLFGAQQSGKTWKTWKIVLFFKKSGKTCKSQGKKQNHDKVREKSGNFFCH